MSKRRILNVILITILVTMLATMHFTVAQEQTENLRTFLEVELGVIEVRVQASREVLPEESMNLTVMVKSKTDDVHIKNLNLTVYGFIGGENKTVLGRIHKDELFLSYEEAWTKNRSILIPTDKRLWGATYGELYIGQLSVPRIGYFFPSMGFPMTYVRNVHLENIEEKFRELNVNFTELQQNYTSLEENYTQLKGNYSELQGNFTELQQNYTSLEESGTEPDNIRHIAIVLAVTTLVFGGTTVYLVMRKPKRTW